MSNVQTQLERSADRTPRGKGGRPLSCATPEGPFRQKRSDPFRSPAFTLVELMVVVGIIVVLVSITMPAIGPMLTSNQQAQITNTLNGLLINAQASATQSGSCVALRVERAFKTSDYGEMVDGNGAATRASGLAPAPQLPDHQQVRFVAMQLSGHYQSFQYDKSSKVYELPSNFWLAPGSSPAWTNLTDGGLMFTPDESPLPLPSGVHPAVSLSRLDNFYIVFDSNGELARYPAANLNYLDQSQTYINGVATAPVIPRLSYPTTSTTFDSATSVIAYDRRQWIEVGDNHAARQSLLLQAQAVNINRVTGSIVEEKK